MAVVILLSFTVMSVHFGNSVGFIDGKMLHNTVDFVLTLSTESCAICPNCAYPDAPCRHPDRMFPCVESYGIVATALAEQNGIEFYNGNLVTWFSVLCYR